MAIADRQRRRPPTAGRPGLSLAVALLLLGACAAIAPLKAAESPPAALSANAEALRVEILDLQVSFAGLVRRVRGHEQALASAEDSLAALERAEAEKLEALARQRHDHYLTLAALQRIALHPRTAVAVGADRPLDALRGALLLKAAVPALEDQAAELRLALEELDALRQAILDERKAIAVASVALEQRRQDVAALIARKKGVLAVTEAELERAAARAATLARQAADLRELMTLAVREQSDGGPGKPAATAGAEAERGPAESAGAAPQAETPVAILQRPDTVRSFPSEPGHILLPVSGRIVHLFGEQAASGSGQDPVLKGIKIRSRPGAEVVAPYDGKVVYAGDFRSYGQILIIDHGGQYHTLLAGLHRIRAVVGQWVLAGEPVATMNPQVSSEPELYLELRRTGQPINPLPWLAEGEQKARG